MQPTRQISLFDAVCLIAGIMIGAGIFESSPAVAQNTSSASMLLLVWLVGGALSLLGAFTYAGLAQAFPETGGDYVYLKRAFGKRLSFVYAWSMLAVVRPGNIGAMAYVFARYADAVYPLGKNGLFIYASASVLLISALNLLGTRESKAIQNGLTVAKVGGIILLVGLAFTRPPIELSAETIPTNPSFTLALIYVLFAYGGWNEIAFVAAEVKNPQRNLFRALVGGTFVVAGIYFLVNCAFLYSLGFEGLRQSSAAAHVLASHTLSQTGGALVSALIAVSAWGALHGMIFSGARIYYAMGQDHRLFSRLGVWSENGTPVWSILTESGITLALMAAFAGSPSGFESFILFTTPLFWLFMVAVALAAFRLLRGPQSRPLASALFLATGCFMLFMSLKYAADNLAIEVLGSVVILVLGVALERVESQGKHSLKN